MIGTPKPLLLWPGRYFAMLLVDGVWLSVYHECCEKLNNQDLKTPRLARPQNEIYLWVKDGLDGLPGETSGRPGMHGEAP